MFITANTRRPATASNLFELAAYFEMVAISQNVTKYVEAGFSQIWSHLVLPYNRKHHHLDRECVSFHHVKTKITWKLSNLSHVQKTVLQRKWASIIYGQTVLQRRVTSGRVS